jgi:RND family efflux transporter MFP subunit
MLPRLSSCPPAATRRSRIGGGSTALATVLLLGLALPAGAQEKPPLAKVVTRPVVARSLTEEVTLPGTVLPWLESLVASETEGRVLSRDVEEADHVRKGQPLIHLDPTRLEKDLAMARAELAEVEANLRLAGRQEERARELHESAVVPLGTLDEAVATREALEGRLGRIEARVAAIEDDLARTVIRAPIAGAITELHTEVGEWIEQGDPVARVTNLDTLEIRLEVPERYFPSLRKDDPATAVIDALPGLELEGRIFALVPRADREARSFPVLVRAPNPGARAAAGMLARVRLVLGAGEPVLLVPKDAIVRQVERAVLFVLDGDAVRAVTVRTGGAAGTLVEVTGDLKEGDRVVVRGNERLQPGQRVAVVDDDGGARSD